jgi:multicomponent Na+:H+ antiporter subunit E
MKAALAHLAIILAATAFSGLPSGLSLLIGFVVGAIVLTLLPRASGSLRYGVRLWRIGKLILVFVKEFTLSVWRVARLVTSPSMRFQPGLLTVPLTLTRDAEITLLANLITLTPGTLTVDVAEDRSYLLVHAVDAPDPDATRDDIVTGFQRLIKEAFEP